jgi:hypothetical protein
VWWFKFIIPALWRLIQEFKAILGYIERYCLPTQKKKNYAASIASFVRCQRYVSMFFLKAGIFKQ